MTRLITLKYSTKLSQITFQFGYPSPNFLPIFRVKFCAKNEDNPWTLTQTRSGSRNYHRDGSDGSNPVKGLIQSDDLFNVWCLMSKRFISHQVFAFRRLFWVSHLDGTPFIDKSQCHKGVKYLIPIWEPLSTKWVMSKLKSANQNETQILQKIIYKNIYIYVIVLLMGQPLVEFCFWKV